MTGRTPSQTIGPFFAIAIPQPGEEFVVPAGSAGAFWLRGRLTDGAGEPVPDGLIETWQADGAIGRSATDGDGRYAIFTTKPAAVDAAAGARTAPHIDVLVFARGLLRHLVTRVYFPDEGEANVNDAVLGGIADPGARATLVATRGDDGYVFDIRLQGDRETVFFDL
jgi:protocatechuate 3,4-dioxygenase alpha subunit